MAAVNLQSNDGPSSPARAPWSKIVTGESSEPSPSAIYEEIMNASTDWYPSDNTVDESVTGSQGEGFELDSGNVVKKPVWSKPLNGVVEVVSPVMGAVCWPALGDSTKAAVKSASSESLNSLSDGSLVPAVQVSGNSLSSSHKPASVNPASTPNHVAHTGAKSVKRGGGSSGANLSSNGGVSESESLGNASGKHDAVGMDSVLKDDTYKGSPRGGFGSQPNSGNEHHYQQNSYRRGNGGPTSRGGGSYQHNNYGGKLEQGHRNFNNRDTNMQYQRGGYRRGGYIRPSVHNPTPFVHPPMRMPVPPFGNNVMYPDVASGMIYFQGPAPPMVSGPPYFPFPHPLHGTIVKQIEYYFSNENLVKDTYLRRNMDAQGWVPVNLIAGFKKVSCLTDNAQLILDVMRQSTVVEVQGDKMRRRNDWMRWLMPPAVQDSLASQLQGIGLDSRPSSGELSSQLQQGGGERAAVA
ncbi:putative la-type HTH domain, winged helix-like DNA-binding domain superfamily [Helianthus annuus]|nr:putative la-type HTH domain, winged helix-like DNA-binding domain superfamily [Helianthus annuus]